MLKGTFAKTEPLSKCKVKCHINLSSMQIDLDVLLLPSFSLGLSCDISIWKRVSDKCGVTYPISRSQVIKKLTVNKK